VTVPVERELLARLAWTGPASARTVPDRFEDEGGARVTSPEAQIASFFANYDPATAKLGKALRARLRDRLPGLHELVYVYENQGSLVFSYSPTEAGAAGVCGVAIYPDRLSLFLNGGDALAKSDPKGLLHGKGSMARHVALTSMADFERPEIEALIAAALRLGKVTLDPSAKGSVVIKAAQQKKRALRTKKTARRT
jgi:uncharacterized protein DUF1801